MFDLIFQGAQAYNQVGFFIGAVVCLGIGGLILGNSFYWRVHALRAQGTVIGVIANGGAYIPVYRYTSADGQSHVAKSDTGSGWLRGKETGRVVPLMISAHNPTQAREARSHLLDLVGIVFVVPGVVFGYVALTAYPITLMTWIMAAGMLLYHWRARLARSDPEREAALRRGMEKAAQYRPDDSSISATSSRSRHSFRRLRLRKHGSGNRKATRKLSRSWPLSPCFSSGSAFSRVSGSAGLKRKACARRGRWCA